jgi:transcriptional regulator GlxA family with amidase domain
MLNISTMSLTDGKRRNRYAQAGPRASASTREVWFVVYPNANLLDATGPAQVFCTASEQAARINPSDQPAYRIRLLSRGGGLIRTSSGIELQTEPLDLPRRHRAVTLVACGGYGSEAAMHDPQLLTWLKAAAPMAQRVGSVCTGAFLLAAAGLLEGRRAVTHWEYCDQLATLFPNVKVEYDAIYVEDGGYWTSAGVTAGLDMAIAMLKRDRGHELAKITARRLVLYLRRAGGQSQFSAQLLAQEAEGTRLRRLTDWISAHPDLPHTITTLAAKAHMSSRSLYRFFEQELGKTPAQFVEQVRLDSAKRMLEQTQDGIDLIARRAGFGTSSRMRAVFVRRLRISPLDYQARLNR